MIYRFLNCTKRMIRTMIASGGVRNGFTYNRIRRLLKKGEFDKGVALAEKAFTRISESKSRKLFKFYQFWQYALEWTYYRAGRPRVKDPLFECRASAGVLADQSHNKTGISEIGWTHLGMRLDGFVFDRTMEQVQVMVDGVPVRKIALFRILNLPGLFHYHVKREVLAEFPGESVVQICTEDGRILACNGSASVKLTVPHGTGQLFNRIKNGASINKKGFFAPAKEAVISRQNRYLKIYEKARDYFDNTFGSPLFLLYGTLLGSYRGGDFIPGDDDFDGGYFSHKTTAAEVKDETMKLVIDLVLAGFTCSFNRKGRLFRLRLADDEPGVHLDLRPVWYEDGAVWAHKQARLNLTETDFLPVKTTELRGVKVYHPNNAEAFLRAYYGPGWKVPDPAYSNFSQRIPLSVIKKLDSICITPADYKSMQRKIKKQRAEYPGAGELISIGSHELYNTEDKDDLFEW